MWSKVPHLGTEISLLRGIFCYFLNYANRALKSDQKVPRLGTELFTIKRHFLLLHSNSCKWGWEKYKLFANAKFLWRDSSNFQLETLFPNYLLTTVEIYINTYVAVTSQTPVWWRLPVQCSLVTSLSVVTSQTISQHSSTLMPPHPRQTGAQDSDEPNQDQKLFSTSIDPIFLYTMLPWLEKKIKFIKREYMQG